ncbi:MAG: diaminopimelate epimerase [Bacteroidota bacterium]
MIQVPFRKMTGAGNDFVVIDNRERLLQHGVETVAQRVCDRKFGVGSDGLLLLEPSSRADFLMRYFNADGSTGSMCGNGGRCIAKFAHSLGIVPEELTFEAFGFVYRANVQNDTVRLRMRNPTSVQSITLHIDGKELTAHFIDTGAPHAVLFSDALGVPLDQLDMDNIGRKIRWHKNFHPEGTNVNVVKLLADNRVYNRTFERGVECETLSCGTGSVAAALVVATKMALKPPVIIQTQSGKELLVDFSLPQTGQSAFTDVVLQGDAHITFVGQLHYDETEEVLAW